MGARVNSGQEQIAVDDVRAVLLAGGRGVRMGALGQACPKPLIPFGGQCHLLDFSIANARRSGLGQVLVLSHHDESQIIRYLIDTWDQPAGFRIHFGPHDDQLRRGGNVADLRPRRPEHGNADALLANAEFIFDPIYKDVLIMHADHVYLFDYRQMLAQHRRTQAALTIAYQEIAIDQVHLFGMVVLNADGTLVKIIEKPANPTSSLVFCAFCIFDSRILLAYLEMLRQTAWSYDISSDVIPAMLDRGERIVGFPVGEYWEDIGTIPRYHRAHLRLLGPDPTFRHSQMPLTLRPGVPRRYHAADQGLIDSLTADDLVNDGLIEQSVVYPGVTVGAGARVRRTVLLPGATVSAGIRVLDTIVLSDQNVSSDRRGLTL